MNRFAGILPIFPDFLLDFGIVCGRRRKRDISLVKKPDGQVLYSDKLAPHNKRIERILGIMAHEGAKSR